MLVPKDMLIGKVNIVAHCHPYPLILKSRVISENVRMHLTPWHEPLWEMKHSPFEKPKNYKCQCLREKKLHDKGIQTIKIKI